VQLHSSSRARLTDIVVTVSTRDRTETVGVFQQTAPLAIGACSRREAFDEVTMSAPWKREGAHDPSGCNVEPTRDRGVLRTRA
jgi:hypothetical protein